MMNQTQSQTSLPKIEEILSGIAKGVWKKDSNEGEAPIPTVADLLSVSHDLLLQNALGFPNLLRHCSMLATVADLLVQEIHPKNWGEDTIEAKEAIVDLKRQWDDLDANEDFFRGTIDFVNAVASKEVPDDIEKYLVYLHKIWTDLKEILTKTPLKMTAKRLKLPPLIHPLESATRAWQQEQTAKHITIEYDRSRPGAIIDKAIIGSREVVLDLDGTGELPMIHNETPAPDQLELWEEDSILPAILPWHRLLWDGISLTTKSGAVSHGVCIADEVFMELEPKQVKDIQKWDLGTLLRALNPNLSDAQISRNRGKYLTHVIKGLKEVQYLGWEVRINGQTGLYLPIKIPQRYMPTVNSPDDFPVIFEIEIPVSGAAGNMLVEKDVIRRTRKKSAKQLNAAKTCYWLIDTHGTQKTKKGEHYLIDTTRPIEARNVGGKLIHPDTKMQIYNSKGHALTEITDPEAVRQLPREKNPQRKRYKVLLPDHRIRAVFSEGVPSTMRRATAQKRADMAFDALADAGYFEIEKLDNGLGGWRIMPSEQHVARYRAVVKASKNAY